MDREDIDPQETREWIEALEAVVRHDGAERGGLAHRGEEGDVAAVAVAHDREPAAVGPRHLAGKEVARRQHVVDLHAAVVDERVEARPVAGAGSAPGAARRTPRPRRSAR